MVRVPAQMGPAVLMGRLSPKQAHRLDLRQAKRTCLSQHPYPHGFLLPLTQYCFVSILLCVQLSRSLCFSWRLSRSYRWALLCCHNLAGWPRPSPQPLPHSPPEHRPQCLLWASLSSTVLGGAQTAVVSQMMMMGKMSKLHKSLTEH